MGKHQVYVADEIQQGRRLNVRYRPSDDQPDEGTEGIVEVFDVATGERIANVFTIQVDGGASKPPQAMMAVYLDSRGCHPGGPQSEVVLNATQRDGVAEEHCRKWADPELPALSSETSWRD